MLKNSELRKKGRNENYTYIDHYNIIIKFTIP